MVNRKVPPRDEGFRTQGLGFRTQGLGFRTQGLGTKGSKKSDKGWIVLILAYVGRHMQAVLQYYLLQSSQ